MKKMVQKLILFLAASVVLHARAGYDPSIQRWITLDPMVEQTPTISLTPNSAPNSQGNFREQANPYLFVLNSPLNYFDPNGLNATTFVDAQGNKFWWGPHDQTPAGYTFQLTPYNQEYKPPGWVWGQDRSGNTIPMPDEQGLQPSLLGELLLPTGAGSLAKPSWLTRLKGPCPPRLYGMGIVRDGQVVAHAPVESLLSHLELAQRSRTLLEAPSGAGVRGALVPGAEAFTYSANGAYLDVIRGSMNFNSTVNNITVNAVSGFVQGLR